MTPKPWTARELRTLMTEHGRRSLKDIAQMLGRPYGGVQQQWQKQMRFARIAARRAEEHQQEMGA
jgi:hypothetical protein